MRASRLFTRTLAILIVMCGVTTVATAVCSAWILDHNLTSEYESKGKALVERIAFVLRGKTEYLLLCRYERGADTEPCDRLLSSFKLAAA